MSYRDKLKRLLQPRTIAVIGGDSAAEVVRQCRAIGFDGKIRAVNPQRETLEGIPCVPSVADLPEVPDASFVAAPPQASLGVIRDLAARGAPGAVCFAAGFAETGSMGAELQEQLREAAGDMAIVGPNCHGYVNYLDAVALWPDQHGGKLTATGVALISQSGNVAINLTMQQRGLDIAYVISVGNNSSLGMHDYVDALLDDSRVTAIGLHIEGLVNAHEFSKAAIRALQKGIPIVVFKAGRSSRGAEITLSHTGSLAGSDRLYSAFFERLGIARCDTVAQFLETLKFVSIAGTLPRPTLGSMSCSGGDASIVADSADRLGVATPPFSTESATRLKKLLGPNVDVANPIDYHLYIWGNYEQLTQCFTDVLSNNNACTLLVLDYPPGDDNADMHWQTAERALLAAVENTGQKAVIVSSLPETMSAEVRERLKAAGIAPMQGIEDCVFAFRSAALIGAAQQTADRTVPVLVPKNTVGDVVTLDEWESKRRLANAGVVIPKGQVCGVDEAAAVAHSLGGRVVLKAVSSELAHKSEAGAVLVGIDVDAGVQAAAESLAAISDRILVEEMVEAPVAELIVGISRDSVFGLTLLLGTGGTLVELLDDTVSLLLPTDRHSIIAAISSLKAGAMINGYRGRTGGNLDAVVDAVEAIVAFAIANAGNLYELDVNPLQVTERRAVAVDALIRMSQDKN